MHTCINTFACNNTNMSIALQKVPLHLSYRIFESSLKRMKLSEDNPNYKNSLKDAGIDSIELKDEKSLKREWKEVQLKISETGVMSITDISSTVHKRDAGIENLQDGKSSEETITSIVEVNKTDSLIENCDVSKSSSVEIMQQSTLAIDTQITKNPMFPNSSNALVATSDIKSTTENSSIKNCTSPIIQHNGNTTKQKNETETRTVPAKLQDAREVKGRNQTANVEDKAGQKTINQPITQLAEESANIVAENTEGTKKLSINNNNNSTDFKAETQKECVKNTSAEAKTGNAGSKIDALSVKLQFQPKMGQVNNTYSKKTPKEKRAILQQGTKKSDVKSSTESTKLVDTKTRTNCGNTTAKISVSCSTVTPPQKSVVSTVTSRNTSSVTDSGRQETLHEKDNPSTSIDVQQALNLLEQKTTNSPVVQVSVETVPKTSSNQVTSTLNQRLQGTSSNNNNNNTTTANEDIVSTIVPNAPTSTIGQTTSSVTFPYTLHDIVINSAAVKPALKNSSATSSCTTLQKALGTSPVVACSTSNSQASLMPPQFNVQTPSMSIYSVSMSLKNNCGNASQGVTTVTATSTATITVTASKPTSVCSVPPCPDAIPISLMKQASIRKQEATAKGTNLNEICAKIGSIGTIGSKINDICAKIGENSKEKNRVEQARGKSDVPDLLKIGTKKSLSSSLPNSDTTIKHIPNIPNVPVYNPSSNATTMENKSTKPGLSVSAGALAVSSTVTSLAPTSSPHMTQRMSSLKKQSQPIGYKTLRDPPKSWNPTLSKNNYVAMKNQAKEMQNQTQTTSASEGTSKQIPSKPAKIFKRNMPRYLGNPASGVKPIYGVTNDAKEKEQSTVANTKNVTLNMMKIDPKTLSPIVSTVNSPIVSPPSPYSPNARSYQNTPYPRDGICRSTGSPISPRNSPVNMLSTNPFIPSPTPNTNPRIIYSHFPPPFPDASRFPNPLIRSPIGIPPPSAFHSSLPPAINKLYQRSASYIPQTTGSYSPVSSQPPAVQRIPPSTHSSSPKSPKASSPSSISCTSFSMGKAESQSPITSVADSVALLLSKNVPVPIPVPSLQRELNAFNLSKTGGSLGPTSNTVVVKTSSMTDTSSIDTIETQTAKQNSPVSQNSAASAEMSGNSNSSSTGERKQCKDADPAQRTTQETARPKDESPKAKPTQARSSTEVADSVVNPLPDKKEKNQTAKVNGDVTTDQFASKKSKEANSSDEVTPVTEMTERESQVERSSSRERSSIPNSNAQDNNVSDSSPASESKNDKSSEQIQGKKSEVQRNKAET